MAVLLELLKTCSMSECKIMTRQLFSLACVNLTCMVLVIEEQYKKEKHFHSFGDKIWRGCKINC
jgi:hypothetical protein